MWWNSATALNTKQQEAARSNENSLLYQVQCRFSVPPYAGIQASIAVTGGAAMQAAALGRVRSTKVR